MRVFRIEIMQCEPPFDRVKIVQRCMVAGPDIPQSDVLSMWDRYGPIPLFHYDDGCLVIVECADPHATKGNIAIDCPTNSFSYPRTQFIISAAGREEPES